MIKISLIQPSRNNLKYLKWSYESIRKNQGEHEVEICVADDFSNDGTWDWCEERMKFDSNFKAIRNEGPIRLGHTILYDKLINEVATNDIAMIYHADMYLCPNALDSIEKWIKPKTIVSLTRIEPPLHPDGPEKILFNAGTEPEEFDETSLLENIHKFTDTKKITDGIFAPWAFYRKDFQDIGGHDPLYAPQSKEDSDIFNRFHLNGFSFIQTWDGFVYHMTCRGSRFNPTITNVGKESDEWLTQNQRSTRNFIRKWGHFVKHTPLMKPIVPPKYNIGIVLENSNYQLLSILEPWCDRIYVDSDFESYIQREQKATSYDLTKRITSIQTPTEEIVIHINGNSFNNNDYNVIQNISDIINDSGAIGQFELGNLKLDIREMNEYQNNLIYL